MLSKFIKLAVAFTFATAITACGGGGGGDAPAPASFTPAPVVNRPPIVIEPPPPSLAVTVSGNATFESLSNISNSSSGLNYAAPIVKPMRGVTVQAVDFIGTVLASTTTSSTGSFVLQFTASRYQLVVRPELIKIQGTATWDVRLKDNTDGNVPWAVAFGSQTTAATATRDITAGTGWNATTGTYTGFRAAGLFAMLDTIYDSMQVIAATQPTVNFPPLSVYWSENNIATNATTNAQFLAGQIGTSFFLSRQNTNGSVTREIYILGKADNDTDEFDSSVIAHEYGHYLQSAFSTNHSLGGSHGAGDKLDMTVAFSESWGDSFSSIARNNPIYADSVGTRQGAGTPRNISVLPTDASRGWYREDSITAILYNFSTNANGGFAKIWTALAGPMKTSQDALATIFSFASAVRGANNPNATAALNTLLTGQNIVTTSATDQWGAGETNNGGDLSNLPIYSTLTFNVGQPACFINTNITDNSGNKLGMNRYYRINLTPAQAGNRTVTVDFLAGRDLDFDVFQRGVLVASADAASGSTTTSESLNMNLVAGEVVIRVFDYVLTAPPVAGNCGNVKIN